MADTRGVAESAPLYGRAQTRSVCLLVPGRRAAAFRRSAPLVFAHDVGGDGEERRDASRNLARRGEERTDASRNSARSEERRETRSGI